MNSEKSIRRCTFLHRRASMQQKSQLSILKNFASEFPILSSLNLPLCGLVEVFIDISTYTLTEDRSFKPFLKEDYAIGLGSSYLFTKKMLNMELKMILKVLLESAYIRYSWNLQQIWGIPSNLSRWWSWQSLSL